MYEKEECLYKCWADGAGKTTFAREFLPEFVHCPNFINADLIAQGLSPFEPQTAAIKAGKLVLQQIDAFADKGLDFGFETTLSGLTFKNRFYSLNDRGYAINLYFLWIPSTDLAIGRIKERVVEGGHNIPAEDVRRRFPRGLHNFFNCYYSLLDSWILFDNSKTTPVTVAIMKDSHLEIINKELFEKIRESAR